MDVSMGENRRLHLLVILIVSTAIIGFLLRMIPITYLTSQGVVRVFENDPWYTLRQVEVMVSQFPAYNWFEPFTRFPLGKGIDWGPLFPFLGGIATLLTGASTRAEMTMAVSWVPPVIALLVVPVIFLIGRKIGGLLTGVFSAALIMLVSGEFFSRSLYGYTDHHIAEVLFTSLFVLMYLVALSSSRNAIQSLPRDSDRLGKPLLLAVGVGITYFIAFLVSATVVLFPLIISIFTFAVMVEAAYRHETPWFIGITNLGAFATIALLTSLFGVKSVGFSLSRYSAAHIIAPILVILCTAVLLLLVWLWLHRRGVFYGAMVISILVAVSAIALSAPISRMILGSLGQFFGQQVSLVPITELQGWNLSRAVETFQVGLILSLAGIILLVQSVIARRDLNHLFLLVWTAVVLAGTALHVRYEYYCAVVIVLTGSYAAATLLKVGGEEQIHKKVDKREKRPACSTRNWFRQGGRVPSLVVGALLLFAGLSALNDYSLAADTTGAIIPDSWIEGLTWMERATPDPGIPYLGMYDRSTFSLPEGAYGVLSWWDYGHWITFLAKRPAISNPFQDNVRGVNGTAAYFLATDEAVAEGIAAGKKANFVITDGRMADTKFRGIASWYNASRADDYYTRSFLRPSGTSTDNSPLLFIAEPYYETMVARLQNADGSEVMPGNVLVIRYEADPTGSVPPRITSIQAATASDALAWSGGSLEQREGAEGVVIVNNDSSHSIIPVPALQHYRLVYEAVPSSGSDRERRLDTVKVFERVAGAKVKGEGTIEIPMVTNTGRTFTYRQASRDGTWVIPYSTTGSPWPVRAAGPGRVVGTGQEIVIREEDVRNGSVTP